MKKGQKKSIHKKPKPFFEKARRKWVAKVRMGNGTYKVQRFDSKEAARTAIEELWEFRNRSVGALTVSEALERWLVAGDWSDGTRVDYERTAARFEALADVPLELLSPESVQQVIDDLPTTAMKARARKVLRTSLNWCQRRGYIATNPVMQTDPVKHKPKEVEVFTDSEIEAIFEAIPERWQLAVQLLYKMAIRPGELWGLQWQDFNGGAISIRRTIKELNGHNVITAPKTETSRRTLPLPADLRVSLESIACSDLQQHIFTTQGEPRPIRHKNFSLKVWRPALKRANIRYKKPYTLRHTMATQMLNSGQVSLSAVSKWLGHATITTTLETYIHLMTHEFDGIAEFLSGTK